ncbi:hypothetical protein EJ05DRAFT_486258 [Pseudovirgaria hyperparasitica]|uniref:Cell wall protein n=1 Tax=Pseudovirgaria hyperparasitica TaxID=470096 RepID=A0A6A6W5K4_9PEZI|nr:uncharacterized protein EJ05DRAFT_486258 [Pseudovirgaria hyperparasitica]KAF2758208.1 hypothetical protein EJ05DRAFT_486258 [Pseudovirgaria hyperparasitica]
MQITQLIPFFLLGAAFASSPSPVERKASLVQRDYATISGVISDVQSKTSSLKSAIDAYQGTGQTASVQNAQDALLNSINTGNSKVAASSSVTLAQAYQIGNQVDDLTDVVNASVDSALNKKSAFVAAGDAGKVKKGFNDLKSAANTLGSTIKSKVPSSAQNLAQQKIDKLNEAIQRGVDGYADVARRAARDFKA